MGQKSIRKLVIARILNLKKIVKRKSVFLLGPRNTGKSFFLKNEFEHTRSQIIIIDEIQRLPELLNNVHYLIESSKHRFILTGSSARKLKKTGVNLLGGRAAQIRFHPFIFQELQNKFSLEKALTIGLLPSIYLSPDPYNDLQDYVGTYLKEEILNEALVRNLPAFSRFLEVAALSNGQMINYTKMASDISIPVSSTKEYFKLLCDTLIARELEAYDKTVKRKNIQASKFYFFDIGVVNAILKIKEINVNSKDFGLAFETYLFHELQAYTDYNRLDSLRYWRSVNGQEVDFILDNKFAIEVKATTKINADDLKGLKALKEENVKGKILIKKFFLISRDNKAQIIDGIHCLPWEQFLGKLWDKGL
jgi:predicted AAA+ superfamily ATPase